MIYDDPFAAMQAAVDIVGTSAHPANKVAATLFTKTHGIAKTNYWPEAIYRAFGRNTDIGNSSGTVHAETAVILGFDRATDGASLCVTDPFCPNCAKNIAEAGIKKIYIDHKGFEKDFFARRSGHFQTMSMQICEKAGIGVYEIWRKDERLVPIYEPHAGYTPHEDSPIHKEPIESPNEGVFREIIAESFKRHSKRKFAVVFAKDANDKYWSFTVRGHAVTGFTMEDPDDIAIIERHEEKYSFFQEPVNRLLMYLARYGMRAEPGFFFSSLVPTSREQVNLVGAGIARITVGDIKKARDAAALAAMAQLSEAKILSYV